ncbi:MAG: hypothetical protein WB662_19830 [Methyloceanibacter sp.]
MQAVDAIGRGWQTDQDAREVEEVRVVDVIKRVPPDVSAMRLWLENRQSELWRGEKPSFDR